MDLTRSVGRINHDPLVRASFHDEGLAVVNVTWEDTGRSKDSCWGPNITDQTLCVDDRAMPIVRRPNFTDKTVDMPMANFKVTVGNEAKDGVLKRIPLKDYLEEKGWYVADRDEHVLVSTQACILPLASGFVDFGVKLYNYQTRSDDPTLAVAVTTPQGTSTAAITDPEQVLYFNDKGTARPFEARRLEEDRKERNVTNLTKMELTAEEQERNVLICFHVPLEKQRQERHTRGGYSSMDGSACIAFGGGIDFSTGGIEKCMVHRGFDAAVLRVSAKDKGPFPSLKPNVLYKRDPRFPIRCVIQYYTVTDSAKVPPEIVQWIKTKLAKLYDSPSVAASGSLVTGTGDANRKTEPMLPSTATTDGGALIMDLT